DGVGDGVDKVKAGDEVIINPLLVWRKNRDAPLDGFEIAGMAFDGPFADCITFPSEETVQNPGYLSWEEAGVLTLSAMTAYRSLFTRAKVREGMTVLIPGATGGAGTFLLQFAKAAGAKVYVTSRSEEKRSQALELGADKAIDSEADWNDELAGEKVDVVIESVG